MTKKYSWEILLVTLLLLSNLQAKPEIIESKVLSGDQFNASDIISASLFIGKENDIVIEMEGPDRLWLNNKWVTTKQYGGFLNGFVKDGIVHLVFQPDEQHIDIYSVKKNITLEQHIPIGDFPTYPGPVQVVYIPGDTNAFYLLGSQEQFPRNPGELIATVGSGGHGTYYDKPVWAEISGQTLLKYQNVLYGGKTDECFLIKAVVTGKDTIRFLGFRMGKRGAEQRGFTPPMPVILHHTEYNAIKKQVVQTQEIYKDTSRLEIGAGKERVDYFYGELSADNINDDVVISFSCIKRNLVVKGKTDADITILSQIYYSQSESGKFGDVEKVGEGLIPLARVDSLGNVHVVWVNNDGALVHRVKKGGKWNNEEVFLNGVDNSPSKLFGKYICAEFDKDNNLNVVFLSNGQLVYAKIRVN